VILHESRTEQAVISTLAAAWSVAVELTLVVTTTWPFVVAVASVVAVEAVVVVTAEVADIPLEVVIETSVMKDVSIVVTAVISALVEIPSKAVALTPVVVEITPVWCAVTSVMVVVLALVSSAEGVCEEMFSDVELMLSTCTKLSDCPDEDSLLDTSDSLNELTNRIIVNKSTLSNGNALL